MGTAMKSPSAGRPRAAPVLHPSQRGCHPFFAVPTMERTTHRVAVLLGSAICRAFALAIRSRSGIPAFARLRLAARRPTLVGLLAELLAGRRRRFTASALR